LLGGLLGLLASYDPRLSIPWLLWLGAGVALYIVIVLSACTPHRIVWAAALPVAVATVGALLLIALYRHLGYERKFDIIARLGAITSWPVPDFWHGFLTANAAASFLEGSLPLSIGLALASRGWKRRWLAACAVVIGYAVLLTASRGSWVALAAGAALAGLAIVRVPGRWRRARLWLAGLGALVCAATSLLLLNGGTVQRALDSARYRTADRLALYRNSLFLALDFPFSGIGAGRTFGMVYSHFQLLILVPFLEYAHNLFLCVWLAQGLLGVLGLCGMILASARLIWRGLDHSGHGATQPIGWGAAIGCVVALLHGLTDAPQYDTCWPALLMNFALLGVAIAAARLVDDRALMWIRLSRGAMLAVGITALVVLLVVGPALLAAASGNVAAIIEAKSYLAPQLGADERMALHADELRWVERGLRADRDSPAVLKRSGSLALEAPDFAAAVAVLEPALRRSPADQSIRKALGYAYVWSGRIGDGVQLFRGLDRRAEIEQELTTWPVAWQERGRDDLAIRAQLAAEALAQVQQRSAHAFR